MRKIGEGCGFLLHKSNRVPRPPSGEMLQCVQCNAETFKPFNSARWPFGRLRALDAASFYGVEEAESSCQMRTMIELCTIMSHPRSFQEITNESGFDIASPADQNESVTFLYAIHTKY